MEVLSVQAIFMECLLYSRPVLDSDDTEAIGGLSWCDLSLINKLISRWTCNDHFISVEKIPSQTRQAATLVSVPDEGNEEKEESYTPHLKKAWSDTWRSTHTGVCRKRVRKPKVPGKAY